MMCRCVLTAGVVRGAEAGHPLSCLHSCLLAGRQVLSSSCCRGRGFTCTNSQPQHTMVQTGGHIGPGVHTDLQNHPPTASQHTQWSGQVGVAWGAHGLSRPPVGEALR